MATVRAGAAQHDGGCLLPGVQNIQEACSKVRKLFFFEKKNQKTFISGQARQRNHSVHACNGLEIKSFLVLFFKKEPLFFVFMIEGHIERLTTDGVVHGWVRDTDGLSPCHMQVLFQGEIVAEAMAATFRADLLRGGHGHGHYGFAARLRRVLPPGPCSVALHLPAHGRIAPMGLMVPALAPVASVVVEDLLAAAPSWTVADLLAAPACLDAAGNCGRLGTARFVDGAYLFVLDRWPSKAEARLHIENLDRGRLGPQDLLLDLLASRERCDLGTALPSPFDSRFPFTLG